MTRVVFCASEVFPFAKTGGLADVVGALPLALEKLGVKVCVFLPHYKGIKTGSLEKISIDVSKTRLGDAVDVYLIQHDKYFNRDGLYGDSHGDFKDNLDRFGFFCMKTLQTLKMLNWHPDVIHCHDWQTALIPVYLKEMFRSDKNFAKTKSVLTIHNLAFQGIFKKEEFSKTGLRPELFMPQTFEFFDKINLLKAGIVYADKVTTVSPQYAKEILTQTYGCGLDGVLRARRDEVIGILNGIDYKNWSPKESPYIVEKFDVSNYQVAKPKNKQWLLEQFNFDLDDEHPVFGFVGRLSHQKGIDLIIESMDDLAKLDVRVIIQGVGEQKYQSHLTELSMRYSNNVAVRLEFEERIAREIYAGSDFFLMPSLFEPCGLAQMIALCHGTIPIAYKTGGLVDTIKPFKEQTREGNGFLFEHYSKADFLNAIKKAIRMYEDKKLMDALKDNAFASNYSWANSAKQYQELYTTCLLSV